MQGKFSASCPSHSECSKNYSDCLQSIVFCFFSYYIIFHHIAYHIVLYSVVSYAIIYSGSVLTVALLNQCLWVCWPKAHPPQRSPLITFLSFLSTLKPLFISLFCTSWGRTQCSSGRKILFFLSNNIQLRLWLGHSGLPNQEKALEFRVLTGALCWRKEVYFQSPLLTWLSPFPSSIPNSHSPQQAAFLKLG